MYQIHITTHLDWETTVNFEYHETDAWEAFKYFKGHAKVKSVTICFTNDNGDEEELDSWEW